MFLHLKQEKEKIYIYKIHQLQVPKWFENQGNTSNWEVNIVWHSYSVNSVAGLDYWEVSMFSCFLHLQAAACEDMRLGQFSGHTCKASYVRTVTGQRIIFCLVCLSQTLCWPFTLKLKPLFVFWLGFLLCCCILWSSSFRLHAGFWLGWTDPGSLERLRLHARKCWALRRLSLLYIVEAHFLHGLLFLERVPSLGQSQLPHHHHLFGVVVAAPVLWWGCGPGVLATSADCVLVASLPSYVQPLTAVLANTDEPGGRVPLHVLQPHPFRQRHLHGVAAGAVGFPVSVVAPCRLVSSR